MLRRDRTGQYGRESGKRHWRSRPNILIYKDVAGERRYRRAVDQIVETGPGREECHLWPCPASRRASRAGSWACVHAGQLSTSCVSYTGNALAGVAREPYTPPNRHRRPAPALAARPPAAHRPGTGLDRTRRPRPPAAAPSSSHGERPCVRSKCIRLSSARWTVWRSGCRTGRSARGTPQHLGALDDVAPPTREEG